MLPRMTDLRKLSRNTFAAGAVAAALLAAGVAPAVAAPVRHAPVPPSPRRSHPARPAGETAAQVPSLVQRADIVQIAAAGS